MEEQKEAKETKEQEKSGVSEKTKTRKPAKKVAEKKTDRIHPVPKLLKLASAKGKGCFLMDKKVLMVAAPLLILALAGAITGIYYWKQYQKMKSNPEMAAQKETADLLDDINKIIQLPKDEAPTIATVADQGKVKDQPFFKDAQNGDKVLIYVKNQKAILFRPSQKKVINVSTVTMEQPKSGDASGGQSQNQSQAPAQDQSAQAANNPSAQQQSSTEAQAGLRVALYNGTTIVGLTGKAEKRINDKLENIEIVIKDNAAKKDYENSILVNLSGKSQDQLQPLSDIFGAQIADLPEGEARPDADVAIILGKQN